MTRSRIALALAAVCALEGLTSWLVVASDHEDYKAPTLVLASLPGLAFVVSGIVARVRRPRNRVGLYLLATGYLWYVGALAESNDGLAMTAGIVLSNFVFIPLLALMYAFPSGRMEQRMERWLLGLAAAYIAAIGLVIALLEPKPNRGCDNCPSNPLALTHNERIGDVADAVATAVGVVLIAFGLVVLLGRWRRASTALRRTLAPVLITSATLLAFLGATNIAAVFSDRVTTFSMLGLFISLAAVPIAFLAGVLRSRLARSAVGDLMLALGSGTPLRAALADALSDPSLEIAYRVDGDRWVDAEGRRRDEPQVTPRRAVRRIEHDGSTVAALVHDRTLEDEPELVSGVAAAAGLALENEGLQAALRAQYDFLMTIVNTAPSLLNVVDTDGYIRNFNRAVEEAAGYDDAEHIRGRPFWDVFISKEERADMIARFEAAKPDFPPSEYENVFTNARGEDRVIAWQSAPVRDEHGRVVSIVAGGIDITERKRRELELQRSYELFETVAEAIPSLLVVVDTEAIIVENGVNREFGETFCLSAAEAVGRSILDLVAPEDEYAVRMAIAAAANGVARTDLEARWLRQDGEARIVAWTATPLLDVREQPLVLITGTDITERKLQDDELRASRSRIVEAADEARRRLERNLHDGAQQRLVAISVSLRLAEGKLESDPAEAAAILARTRGELGLALDELRELARGIHPAVLTDRGLAAAVESVVARSPLPVAAELPDDRLPPAVEAAAYYVVSEALANVAKYARATSASVKVRSESDQVVVEVCDDGVGGADPDRGTGLRGLADRLSSLDGRLTVDSPAGGGTCVRAEIPARRLLLTS